MTSSLWQNGSFAALELLGKVATLPHASVLTRLRLDAALYDPRPHGSRRPWAVPGLKGSVDRRWKRCWQISGRNECTVRIEQWYGKGPREVEVTTDTAVWYLTGKPPVAIRWVLIRDPQEDFKLSAVCRPIWHIHRSRYCRGLSVGEVAGSDL